MRGNGIGASRSSRWASRWASVVLATSAVLLLSAPGALAGGVGGTQGGATPSTAWAFGAERSFSASGTAAGGNSTQFSLSAHFGWNTVLVESAGPNATFSVVANRTMGASLSAEYCRPDCRSMNRSLNVTERVWETQVAYANFSSNGTIATSTGPSAAISILNSHVVAKGVLLQTATVRVQLPRGVATADSSVELRASSDLSVDFQPGLGLFPMAANVSNWSGSSNYTAHGSWLVSRSVRSTGFLGGTTSASQSYPGSVQGLPGLVRLNGSGNGTERLAGGLLTTRAELSLTGPFTVWEGFILLPSPSDLIAPAPAPWQGNVSANAVAQTDAVDIGRFQSLGHLPVVASAAGFAASSTDSGTPALDSGVSTMVTGGSLPVGPDGPGAALVQAQPESPSAANASSACLITSCSGPVGPHGLPRGLLLLLIGALVATVVAVTVIAARQPPRKVPPPPTATLYPPLGSIGTGPENGSPTVGRAKRPDPSKDDPLGHLW